MILMIDNYDSFTYNLVQYLGELGIVIRVVRNNQIDIKGIKKIKPQAIVISPGPGRPDDAGISKEVIENFYKVMPILGVCLGHQCIGEVFGAQVVRARRLMHGKTSLIYHKNRGIFKNLTNPFVATRYHSLIVDNNNFPRCLSIEAYSKNKNYREIMAIKHRDYPVWGVQFHPESILTSEGKKLLKNFLSLIKKRSS
jgi:anthranilate synthase/aminodeoxychorismate synthase-like glutamine amidotransferase